MKFTWLLAFKIFIVLLWILCMIVFMSGAINSQRTFLELLDWDIALIFVIILLGCLSVILEKFYKKKSLMIIYFLSWYFIFPILT
ncbi:hypothetical protein OQH60_08635, partial [Campylobacter sp. MIT 21-1685]|uniref:hypothetical protein n=1 Tax=unclassified Campylobacter TaxID=2593542 RepID=UPI00224AC0A7